MALGEKRNGSVFATAAQRRDAAEYQVTLEPEVVPVVVDDTPQRTLNTDIGTLGRAHNLFFTPSAEGRDFNSVLQEVQEYISGAYAALITGGGEDSKEQLMRYITKYLQDRRSRPQHRPAGLGWPHPPNHGGVGGGGHPVPWQRHEPW